MCLCTPYQHVVNMMSPAQMAVTARTASRLCARILSEVQIVFAFMHDLLRHFLLHSWSECQPQRSCQTKERCIRTGMEGLPKARKQLERQMRLINLVPLPGQHCGMGSAGVQAASELGNIEHRYDYTHSVSWNKILALLGLVCLPFVSPGVHPQTPMKSAWKSLKYMLPI